MAIPSTLDSGLIAEMLKTIAEVKPAPFDMLAISPGMKAGLYRERQHQAASFVHSYAQQPAQFFAGLPVYTADIPPEEVLDWSECRSPSRAKRRHARGIKTKVKVTYREVGYLLDSRVFGDLTQRFERMAVKALFGELASVRGDSPPLCGDSAPVWGEPVWLRGDPLPSFPAKPENRSCRGAIDAGSV